MIKVILENLRTGNVRVTGKDDGRTILYKEGSPSEAVSILTEVLIASAKGHTIVAGKVFNCEYISFNDDALKILPGTFKNKILTLK